MYDLIIIGLGPAGYTAALYAARYRLKTLQIGEMPGGMISEAPDVCNFPSYEKIGGMELAMKMEEQVKALGVDIVYDRVVSVEPGFKVKTSGKEFQCSSLILATGQIRRKIGLPDEERLTGRGVSYCATCDAAFYKGKTVGVVGGGNSALAAAKLLSRYADEVNIYYRKKGFLRPEPIRVKEVEEADNINTIFETKVTKLFGDEKLEAVELNGGEREELDGLFVEIGSTPNSTLAEELGISTNDRGYIVVDDKCRTDVNRVYAAGDVTDSPLKQAITAAGQGAVAADSAYDEMKKEKQDI